jgi:predicted DNA-binding transcriptional regulator AlpA
MADVPSLTAVEAAARAKISLPTLYRLKATGNFPAPVHLPTRCVRYRESEIVRWLKTRYPYECRFLSPWQRGKTVKNLLDPTIYPLPVVAGRCFSCGSDGSTLTRELVAAFRKMTGLSWGWRLLVYPLGKDFRALGIISDDVPDSAQLCLPCAVKYMTDFDDRLHAPRPA